MTRRSLSLLATTAAFSLFGGLHFEIASGRALDRLAPDDARLLTAKEIAVTGIDRSAKGDRAEVSASATEGRTITFQHPELPSTTVVVRLWETAAAKSRPASGARKGPAARPKQAVACESVVSGLIEVAKQLQAGRCVT